MEEVEEKKAIKDIQEEEKEEKEEQMVVVKKGKKKKKKNKRNREKTEKTETNEAKKDSIQENSKKRKANPEVKKHEEAKKQYFTNINNKALKYKSFNDGKTVIRKDDKNKKLIAKLEEVENISQKAAVSSARAEILLTDEVGYLETNDPSKKAFQVTQKEIKEVVDLNAARKSFEIFLDTFGPYKVEYTNNGKYALLFGQKGHLAMFDWKKKKLSFESHLNQTVRDVKFLHNQSWFAAAQKDHVYIYSEEGVELHVLEDHEEIQFLEFLQHHWLLVSCSFTRLLFKDVSIGKTVSQVKLKGIGVPTCLTKNPWNAMTCVGDSNGVVSMWAPSYTNDYVVKLLCHKGPIHDICVDLSGNYLVTSGLDRTVRVFDIRMFKELQNYSTGTHSATSIALSQKNIFAMSTNSSVKTYKNIFNEAPSEPYLLFHRNADINCLKFVPYEDVLGIGHSQGFSSILIPGSAEPNFDTFVDNPYMKTKQLREHVISSLLQKVQPDLIQLEPDFVGEFVSVDPEKMWRKKLDKKQQERRIWKPKVKSKGKHSSTTSHIRKQKGKWDKQRDLIKEQRDSNFFNSETERKIVQAKKKKELKEVYGSALHRFAK